jgi:hypothetical protein
MNNSGSGFAATSFFNRPFPRPTHPPAPDKLPRALFSSTEDQITVSRATLVNWARDIEDVQAFIDEGNLRGWEDAMREMGLLRDRIEDVVRSANGTSHSDRPAG